MTFPYMTKAERAARRAERLVWLQDHPDLLAQLPGAQGVAGVAQMAALDLARVQMTAAGLYATTRPASAARWSVRLLVSEIRGEDVTGLDPRDRTTNRHRLTR